MNKQLLSLGIILSLGTVGCAGFGVQQSSSLTGQIRQDQGLDNLWAAEEQPSAGGLEAPRYANRSVLDLWDGAEPAPEGAADPGYSQSRSGGDLWNSASVSRPWDGESSTRVRRDRGLSAQLFSDFSTRRHARRSQTAAQ